MTTKSIIVTLLFAIFFAACAPITTKGETTAVPTNTLFASSTAFTVSPTITVSPTQTSRPVPTYTPANPNGTYEVGIWSAEEADLLIAQIASSLSAIESEPMYQSVYGWASYMEHYKYLAFAEKEALLRFPNASQEEKWQWDLCYNLAFSYQPGASSDAPELPCYGQLIENELNSGETTLADLPKWFEDHEPRIPFTITSFATPAGFTSAYIITLEYNAMIWLLEQSGKFHTTGLRSSIFYYREAGAKFNELDVTGDSFPELLLDFSLSHCCGAFSRSFVYDVSSGTPRLLPFKNTSGMVTDLVSDYESIITPLEAKSEHPGFIFNSHYGYDPLIQPCNIREYDKYYWDGYQFELGEMWFGINPPGEYDDKEFCQFLINTAKEPGELEAAVRTIGSVQIGDPDVTRDQILYKLGEYQARLGNIEKAKEYFNAAISLQPTDKPASKWAYYSQLFLDNLQAKDSYYSICSKVVECSMHGALQQIIGAIQPSSFLSIPQILKDSTIPIKSNGYVNFDSSGNIEQWLVVQHPNRSNREFWILVQAPKKIYAEFVADIPANQPKLKEFRGSNNYVLTTSDGESLFSLENLTFSGQPYVVTHSLVESNHPILDNDYLQRYWVEIPLDDLTNELFTGADPASVLQKLQQLAKSTTFDCKKSNVCDQVDYLLGLTNELLGNNQVASEVYVQLWKDYPDSLYAIMARSKLENSSEK